MVCDWSPEPPRDGDDRMSMPCENIAVESEESEDETLGQVPPGYELLPQAPPTGPSSEEDDQSETETAGTSGVSSDPAGDSCTSNSMSRRHSNVEEVDRLYSAPDLRPELTVDCDQVRAAMSGFTLPQSAIPAWAINVPESQWADTLSQQIRRMQGGQPKSDSGL